MRIEETQNLLKSDGMRALFGKMYGQSAVEENIARYEDLVEKFRKEFGDKDILLFSSPGRTEILQSEIQTPKIPLKVPSPNPRFLPCGHWAPDGLNLW